MKATITLYGTKYNVILDTRTYGNGATAIQLVEEDGSPFATLSVNLPESVDLPPGAFYAKYWSECAGIVEQLLEQGVIEQVEARPAAVGFMSNILAYRLTD